MKNPKKTQVTPINLLTNIVSVKIDSSYIDYEVSFDITGKIYDSKPLYEKLPEHAQRLVIEKNNDAIKQKIAAFQKTLPVLLPLSIVNQNTFFKKEFKEVNALINIEIEKQGIEFNKVYELAEAESVEYYILSSFMNPSLHPENFNVMWKKVIELLNKTTEKKDPLGFQPIAYPPLTTMLLTGALFPYVLKDMTVRAANSMLEKFCVFQKRSS